MGLFYFFSQQMLSSFEYIKLPSFVLNLQFFLIPVAFLFCYFFLSSFLRPFNRTSQMKLKILRDLLEIKYPLEKFIFCIHYLSSLEYSLTLPIAAINNANVRERVANTQRIMERKGEHGFVHLFVENYSKYCKAEYAIWFCLHKREK